MTVRVVAIIPARMASSRFPGKPLTDFFGMPMIEHVRRRASLCGEFAEVVVATCDKEIADVVERNNGKVIMTSDKHLAASDRIAEAAQHLNCTHVVNVQGDEVLVLPEDLSRMIKAIDGNPEIPVWNAVAGIEKTQDLSNRSIVKCAVSVSGRILYCSRDFSGIAFGGTGFDPIRVILGILSYRKDFLLQYSSYERTPLEVLESIDQMRSIERDIVLRGVPFTGSYPGVNTSDDAKLAQWYLENDPRQKFALETICRVPA